jgi:hypothetical protein
MPANGVVDVVKKVLSADRRFPRFVELEEGNHLLLFSTFRHDLVEVSGTDAEALRQSFALQLVARRIELGGLADRLFDSGQLWGRAIR